MTSPLVDGSYDEALERLHRTGPEFDGWMSNHGPMAVDALARHGSGAVVHAWTDRYAQRLDPLPTPQDPILARDWTGSLGDPDRLGDWIAHLVREVNEQPWTDVLAAWWPRLLSGIAAGATHGVIRTGHAVRALREEVTGPRLDELGHALGYWAARWQPVPQVAPTGAGSPRTLVRQVPRVPDQVGGIRERLAQLGATPGWQEHVAGLHPVAEAQVPAALDELVDAVVVCYPDVAQGNPTMLVHAATAPNAVARALPSLPSELWRESYGFAWTATAAVLAAYLPGEAEVRHGDEPVRAGPDEMWEAAVSHGGEHVIKLADTACDVHARTGDPAALAAIRTAIDLDA